MQNYLMSPEFLMGASAFLDANRPRYAVGRVPEPGPSPALATAQGVQAGRRLGAQQELAKRAQQTGFTGIMDDPTAVGLMAEADPETLMRGIMMVQAAKQKARYPSTRPSSLTEWEAYQNMSPEDQERYLTMKRANRPVDFGGYHARVPQADPTAAPIPIAPKTLPPQDLPSTRGAQAEEAAAGKGRGEERAATEKLSKDATKIADLTTGVEDIIQKSTGSGLGTMVDSLARFFGQATEGAVAGATLKTLQSSLLRFVPRLEGPQSDFDRRAYEEAIGKLGDTSLTRDERIASLNEVRRIAQKYQFYGDMYVPNAGTTGKYAPVPNTSPTNKASGTTTSGVKWSVK